MQILVHSFAKDGRVVVPFAPLEMLVIQIVMLL